MEVSGREVELQKGFVDASVMVREEGGAVIALTSQSKSSCSIYILKDVMKPFSYELDSTLTISEGNVGILFSECFYER